ncbi:SDR family oxidoreductase [Hoeflea ulvae]|uniref:SDR family oxidoreductase n=1 Tax=Hoeflea ulvae TaxID=2983764 RepID=A0ABT3YG41_9HYPH|nr:SDR family oxidoreductase [Hoeflea ulvae]MCY0094867.1 SDR family oxidoreductase [Hoeflea ulvae]
MKTILITGCSSGFGRDTALYFLDRGWNVVATMRTLRDDVLPQHDRLRLVTLDVTDAASIRDATRAAGPVDVLVNNAGIGWFNALEGTPMELARGIFETNTLGTMAMSQAVLPQFRQRRAGVIINVSSSVTLKPLHLLSAYTASKAAVNAFTQVLALELEPFGIRAHVVLPGRSPDTRFGESAMALNTAAGGFPEAYAGLVQSVVAERQEQSPGEVTHPADVAEAIWRAATDPACPLLLPAGADAVATAQAA